MDVARLIGADVVIAEKPGGITLAYPVSYQGNIDLISLIFKRHEHPEDGNSFYAMPFELAEAKKHLESKFEVEYVP
jgi:adenine/guanine phosphoribosyltransferase-like PRPP-binding protein